MNWTNQKVRMSIPVDADFIDVVRLSLYGLATRMGFSFEDIEDMKVAVSEACNNAILHAYGHTHGACIDIIFETMPDRITITVKDYGDSFNYEKAAEKADSLHNKQIHQLKAGGLGIYMMQALMDEVVVNTGEGTEVILTKLLTVGGGKAYGAESDDLSRSDSRRTQ